MKKRKVLVASLLATVFAASAGALVACGDGVELPPEGTDGVKHVVTFDANGGAFGAEKQVKVETDANGKIITEPTKPTYADHTFKGYTLKKDGDSILTFGENGYKFEADQTVYAKWEAKSPAVEDIVITFNVGENGTMTGETTAKAVNGKLASLPDVTANEGWIWNGWYTAATEGTKVSTETEFTKSATIYAQYTANTVEDEEVTITLNVGAGTLPAGTASTLKTVGGKLSSLPTPTAPEGKEFDGWYTAATEGTKVTLETEFKADGTIYAVYKDIVEEDNEFTITFVVGDHGTLVDEETTAKTVDGMLVELPEVEVEGDYKLVGWYTEATGGTEVTDETVFENDATIYARYALKDGIFVNNKLVAELEEQTAEHGAERQFGVRGVELSAGDVVIIKIDGKQLTHEKGTLELHLASAFNPHGVTLNQADGTFVIKPGEKREFYIYARYYTDNTPCWSVDFSDGLQDDRPLILNGSYLVGTGFDNANWNLSPDNYIDPVNGLRVKIYEGADFKIADCSNINDPDNGRAWNHNTPDHYSMAAGEEGLEFDNIGPNGGATVITAGEYLITVTGTGANARFVFSEYREEYTITLDVGEGTLPDDAESELKTVKGKLSLPTPTPDDESKMFNGWYTEATGGSKVTADTVFDADGTIYAQYIDKPNQEYTISFNAGEHGTCTEESMETVDGKLSSLPTVTPEEGYEFDGWYTAAENGDKVTTDYSFTSSIELVALYKLATTVTITTEAPSMKIGDTLTLQATAENYDGALTWKSSSTATATVDATGKVTAKKPGTATITVTAGTATATLTITVVRTYYLRGSIMGWDPAVTTLTQSGIAYFIEDAENPGVYKAEEVTIKKNDEFKIASVNEAWNNKFTGEQFTLTGMTDYFELTGTAGDKNVKCKSSGKFTVTLDLTNASSPVITITLIEPLSNGITSATAFTVNGAALSVGWNGTTAVNFTKDSETGKWSATTTFTISAAGQFQFRWKKDGTQMYVDSRVNYTGKPKIDNFDDIEGLSSTYGNGNDGNYNATAAAIGTYSVTMTITEEGDVESIVVTKQA